MDDGQNPYLKDILKVIYDTKLFPLSGIFKVISARTKDEKDKFNSLDDEDGETTDEAIEAWDLALEAKVFQKYQNMMNILMRNLSLQHTKVLKGLEFPRVVVIIDDVEARGFMFSYDNYSVQKN